MNLSIGIERLIIACWHWVEKLIVNVTGSGCQRILMDQCKR